MSGEQQQQNNTLAAANTPPPAADDEESQYTRVFDLERNHELRFETGWDEIVELKLLRGKAELFGTELAANTGYRFTPGTKRALFTYHGCKISLTSHDIAEYYTSEASSSSTTTSGVVKKRPRKLRMEESALTNAYVAGDTPMTNYLAVHKQLERYRQDQQQQQANGSGPRVLIVGPTDSGKSSLCRILCNYAVREVSPEYTSQKKTQQQQGSDMDLVDLNSQNKVVFVDLDVGQNHVTIPGMIAAAELKEPLSIVEEFSLVSPLAFFYGHTSPSENADLYRRLMERMAEIIDEKQKRDEHLRRGGFVINTCGWIDGLGYQLLLHTARVFRCTHIYVMGDDRLTANLTRELGTGANAVKIERLRKSGGVVQRSTNYRKKSRDAKFREYFYGMDNNLSPYSILLKFDDIDIYQIGGAMSAPKSALPIGEKSAIDPCELRPVDMNERLTHSVLGVSHASKMEDVVGSNLCGFVYVEKVNNEKRELHVLSPSPTKPPRRFLLCGSLKWLV